MPRVVGSAGRSRSGWSCNAASVIARWSAAGRGPRTSGCRKLPAAACQRARRRHKVWRMTLIGEVPPGLAATAARIGDAATVLDEDQVTAFVHEQLAAAPFDGRSVCVLVPDAHPHLPAAAAAARGARRAARAGQPADGAGRAGHARADGRGGAGRATSATRRAGSRRPIPAPRWSTTSGGSPETFADLGTIPAARIAELSEGRLRPGACRCCSTARSSSTTSRWSSARCSRTRSSGSPAATSTSSPASAARRSSTSRTGWAR